jgi:hypothetical protein
MFVGNQRIAPARRARGRDFVNFRKFIHEWCERGARAGGFISTLIRPMAFQDLTSANIGNGR